MRTMMWEILRVILEECGVQSYEIHTIAIIEYN